jgi:hypothetical protein
VIMAEDMHAVDPWTRTGSKRSRWFAPWLAERRCIRGEDSGRFRSTPVESKPRDGRLGAPTQPRNRLYPCDLGRCVPNQGPAFRAGSVRVADSTGDALLPQGFGSVVSPAPVFGSG